MEVMVEALTEMRRIIVSTRVLLKPSFQDFDRTKSCHVTAMQFERVLKNLGLLPSSDQVFDLIIRKYLDKNNRREVNYFQFCADVDRPEDMFGDDYKSVNAPKPKSASSTAAKSASYFFAGSTKDINVLENRYLQPAVHIANDPTDVELRLQALIVMKRVRIEEFFRDFDKLRKGKVTVPQFRTVLSMLNFPLTEAEFGSLAEKYNAEGHFGYAAFCAAINLAFTQKGIDKDPIASVKPVTRDDTFAARRKYLEFTQEEEDQVLAYLEEYRTAVLNRRIHLKPQFQDFDITKCGHVTKSQFLRVLTQLGIYAPESVLNLVLRRYMDKGNADEVNYVDFCNEVDTHEGIFGVGRAHGQSFDYYPRTQPRKVETEIVKLRPDDVEDVLARIRLFCK